MVLDAEVAIVGAGPYGMSVRAHLRSAGVESSIFGDPMSFWKGMPEGMLLRSNWPATCIVGHTSPFSLDAYQASTGDRLERPFPIERFVAYGEWVQQAVAPDVDRRTISHIAASNGGFVMTLEDGDQLTASRVVVAAGIGGFEARPRRFRELGEHRATHTGDHRDLDGFRGKRVTIVGGGQSALESAALLAERGATPDVLVREDHVHWLHGGKYHRALGRFAPIVYAPTDVGPMGLSRVVAIPDLFRRLPRPVQDPLAARSIRPAGAAWLRERLRSVPIRLSSEVVHAKEAGDAVQLTLRDGDVRTVDHLLLGTGYRIDVRRYPFLDPELVERLALHHGYPILHQGFESSVPGLHFVGAPAAWSFGPTMRFISGSWYAGRSVASRARESRRSRGTTPAGHVVVG